jgi:hypothetical protein
MKITTVPMTRPSTPGVSIPANNTQKTKTGQSPGKPATTHQIPSCGVIQITHKPTNEKFICSTADIKKTLRGIFKGCEGETMSCHPSLISVYNGGSPTTITKTVCGGFPTAGGFTAQGNYTLPVYNPTPIRSSGSGGLAGPCFVGPTYNIKLPGTTKNIIKMGGGGGGGSSTTTVRGGTFAPYTNYWAGPTRDPWLQICPPPRPTSKGVWDASWLCRFDRGTVAMNDLMKYEIAFKNAVLPNLNGDKGPTAITSSAPWGGSVTTRYNFCGTNGTGGGGAISNGTRGGFCSTPTRTGGGIGTKPRMPRGNYVKQAGGHGIIPNSAGKGVPSACGGANCCNSPGNAYDFDRRQNPVSYKPGFETIKKFARGPYAETKGGRDFTQKKMRNYEKSAVRNCWDRRVWAKNMEPVVIRNLPKCPMPYGGNSKMSGSRIEARLNTVTRTMSKK